MGRMSELDAEIRQNADQKEETNTVTSKLREAAQAMLTAWENGGAINKHFFLDLRDALAEPDEVLAEREACAQACDKLVDQEIRTGKVDHNEMPWTMYCGQAIRARGSELVPSDIMSSHKKVL